MPAKKKITPTLAARPKSKNQVQILDFLYDITTAADTAFFIGQDVQCDYFEALRMDEEDGRALAAYDFERYKVKMAVVFDAISKIHSAIKAINVLVIAESAEPREKASQSDDQEAILEGI